MSKHEELVRWVMAMAMCFFAGTAAGAVWHAEVQPPVAVYFPGPDCHCCYRGASGCR